MRNPFKITINMDNRKVHKIKCIDEEDGRKKMEEWFNKLK